MEFLCLLRTLNLQELILFLIMLLFLLFNIYYLIMDILKYNLEMLAY